jgi:ABC-type branched-subunit amino acid transport system substrate-binding protein
VLVLTAGLAACGGTELDFGTETPPVAGPAADPMVIGTGETTIALLLPLSAGGSASGLAEIFRNAAELALADADRQAVRVLVKDTQGSEDGGRFAAETAVAEGARMIIGPIFAPAVVGAGGVARSAGIPMVAFSTDAAVAGRGINLLSFLPRQDAERVVSYAANQGRRGFAALVPNNAYGVVMEAAFREAVANSGVNAVMVERYEPGGDIAEKAAAIAGRGEQIDAVFIPNGGDDPSAAAAVLFSRGMSRNKVKLLGSGQWDNRAVLQSPGSAFAVRARISGQSTPFPSRKRRRLNSHAASSPAPTARCCWTSRLTITSRTAAQSRMSTKCGRFSPKAAWTRAARTAFAASLSARAPCSLTAECWNPSPMAAGRLSSPA